MLCNRLDICRSMRPSVLHSYKFCIPWNGQGQRSTSSWGGARIARVYQLGACRHESLNDHQGKPSHDLIT
jgi:hypothetical protein